MAISSIKLPGAAPVEVLPADELPSLSSFTEVVLLSLALAMAAAKLLGGGGGGPELLTGGFNTALAPLGTLVGIRGPFETFGKEGGGGGGGGGGGAAAAGPEPVPLLVLLLTVGAAMGGLAGCGGGGGGGGMDCGCT